MTVLTATAAGLFCLGVGIALLAPLLAVRAPLPDTRAAARRHLVYSAFVAVVWGAGWAGITFAWHAANVGAVMLALLAGGALALFVFSAAPRRLAVLAGVLCTCAWMVVMLSMLFIVAFEGNSPMTVDLGDGLVCRETVYGMVTSDSGEDMDILRRTLFIDRRLYAHRASAPSPEIDEPVAPAWRRSVERCQTLVDQARKRSISPAAPAPP